MKSRKSSSHNIQQENTEQAILVGLKLPEDSMDDNRESLQELSELARTAGAEVLDIITQSRSEIDPRYFIGKGKLNEIDLAYNTDEVTLIIFNHELSPSQARNIQNVLHKRILTRTELIMDIFAIHAQSKAARLQVELAQSRYQLSRLVGKGKQLSRQEGRIGTRGPGERQIEFDRRALRNRIHAIRGKLKSIARSKATQRKRRSSLYNVAIVGYTNSGKSTLLNRLVKAGVLTEDKLFATLDTTTRKLWLGDGIQVLMTDTVGFIRDIPHGLIESFKSTLQDTLNADLLLHVVDSASSAFQEKIRVVRETIDEIGGGDIPIHLCFNKIDLLSAESLLEIRKQYPEASFISAQENTYIDELKESIKEYVRGERPYKENDNA